MKKLNIVFALVFYSMIASAGWWPFGGGDARVEKGITFGTDVPKEQVDTMVKDLNFLETFNPSKPSDSLSAELKRVMKIDGDNLTSAVLNQWLRDRAHYVVSEKFNLEKNLKVLKESQLYPNSNDEPEIKLPTKNPGEGDSKVKTIMSNIGSAVYFAGKSSSVRLGVEIEGVSDAVDVRSPRVGIFQVGEGLFSPPKKLENFSQDSTILTISRLTTFFHEARHSDGHGKSLGFFHVACPKGHDYEGYAACDANENGPYTVGAVTTQIFLESCKANGINCSPEEQTVIEALVKDSENRVIRKKIQSDGLEKIKVLVDSLKLLLDMCAKMSVELKTCKDREKLQAEYNRYQEVLSQGGAVPVGDWDDEPESL